jgi:hypothetical protein
LGEAAGIARKSHISDRTLFVAFGHRFWRNAALTHDPMSLYLALKVIKFLAVMAYAGGLAGCFVARDEAARRAAVHRVASPALLAVWCAGYALAWSLGVSLFELWIVAAFVLSILANVALVYSVSRGRRTLGAFVACALPIVATVVIMVVRPTWSTL